MRPYRPRDQQKVVTLSCGYREWLHWVPLVVNQSLSLAKQWASLTELCTRQKASELLSPVPESDSYSCFAKVSKPAKATLGIILFINWLLAWSLIMSFPLCRACVQIHLNLCTFLIDCVSRLFCHLRDPQIGIFVSFLYVTSKWLVVDLCQ